MSDKTFLQNLDVIKRKIELIRELWTDKKPMSEVMFNDVIDDVQGMINQCIEIQLAIMKQEREKHA